MTDGNSLVKKQPHFYKSPSAEDIEKKGWVLANVHARNKARIVGSRWWAAGSALAIGASVTYINRDNISPTSVLLNFVAPAAVSSVAQLRFERNARGSECEFAELLPSIIERINEKGPYPNPPPES